MAAAWNILRNPQHLPTLTIRAFGAHDASTCVVPSAPKYPHCIADVHWSVRLTDGNPVRQDLMTGIIQRRVNLGSADGPTN
jgi:hypothetical protein